MPSLIVEKTEALKGKVKAPPSKAYTHRALIAASLSGDESVVQHPLVCEDTVATVEACRMLGASITLDDESAVVKGLTNPRTPEDVVDCGGSGSTIRFLTPVCALADGMSVLSGNGSLRRRPMEPLLEALRKLGVNCYSTRGNGCPPIVVFGGGIKGGKATIVGDVSSQFISGLLFALPKARESTEINVTTELESSSYVEMTVEVLSKHGVRVGASGDYRSFHIPNGQVYRRFNHLVPGDYSSAAFLLAAAAVTNSKVQVTGLPKDTCQGDKVILESLGAMGVKLLIGPDYVEVLGCDQPLKGLTVDVKQTPDLTPVYAVLGCYARGKTVVEGAGRLRFKESDRLYTIASELRKMGAKVLDFEDLLVVEGPVKLYGASLEAHNDHRVAMACAVAALGAEGCTTIRGVESISKSYPNFVKDMRSLGAMVSVR